MEDLDFDLLERELLASCYDAQIDPASLVVFVVNATRPPGTTPLAYLQPAGSLRADTVLVFRAVGAPRLNPYDLRAHRLAIWRALPLIPDVALGLMLRHELEHARRFERSGPAFFEVDGRARAAVDKIGGVGYARLPSEREANAAAAMYATRTLSALERRAVADCEDCAGLLSFEAPPGDVVEETLAQLARLGALPGGEAVGNDYLDTVRRECAAWALGPAPVFTLGRDGARIELVDPLEAF